MRPQPDAPSTLELPCASPSTALARARHPGARPLIAALALCGLASVPAWGEDPAPDAAGDAAASTHQLATVVVTSQKRREDIRQVPMAVTAISGDALAEKQVTDITDLTRAVPNVSFSAQGGAGPGLGNLEIRGVSSQAGSSTVGMYLDDVSLTTRNLYSEGMAEPRFFDIDRVEVLRGPQGTLYGASSEGGTIRFISNAPDLRRLATDAHAEVSTTDHGGTNSVLQAVLNAPLVTGSSAIRLGVQSGHESGYIDQVDPVTLRTVSKGINGQDWNVVKLLARFQSGGWSWTPSIFWQRTTSADIDATYANVGSAQAGNPNAPLPIFETSKTVREPGKDTLSLPALTVTGDLGFADFTGVANGYDRHFSRTQDGTFVNSAYVGGLIVNSAVASTVSFLPSAVYLDNRISQAGLELRLASKSVEESKLPLTWVSGVFLQQTKTDVTDSEPIFGITRAFTNAGLDINDLSQWTAGSGMFPGAFPNDNSYFSNRHYKDRQDSVFGDLTWHAADHLRLSAGLRYLHATEDFRREGGNFFAGSAFSSVAISTSANKATPRFAINYDLDPQTTVYASAAQGFRLGGANRPIPADLVAGDLAKLGLSSAPDTFKPDSLWSYEIGSKSRLLDNRLSLALAAFYINWTNIQQDIYLPSAGFDFETNVGNANSSGLEWELKARATDDLTLDFNGGIVRAVFSQDQPALGTQNGVLNVHKGDMIAGVPRFNAQLGADYRFRVADHDSYARFNLQAVGSSHGSIVPGDPDYNRPAYKTAAASWGVALGEWDLALNVKNLFNDRTPLQHPNIQSVNQVYYLRPRTIGLSLTGQL